MRSMKRPLFNNRLLISRAAWWSGGLLTLMSISLAIVIAVLYSHQSSSSTYQEQINSLQQIQTRHELRVGMLRTLTPLYTDYRNPNKAGGFDYALLSKFANSLNVKLKIVYANSPDHLLTQLQERQIDLIATEVDGYPAIQQKVVASEAYHSTTQQLVYYNGAPKPNSFKDIRGNLVVPNLSAKVNILLQVQPQYPNLIWDVSDVFDQEDLLKLVADREIEYTIADAKTVALMQRIYPRLAVAFSANETQDNHWYFAHTSDPTLLNKANAFIGHAQKDGTITKLEQRYLTYLDNFDYVDAREFINAIDNTLPRYQKYFELSANNHQLDWKLLAAVAYQESHWDPMAVSATGVKGIMMLTQNTAETLGLTNRLDPEQSIHGGGKYLRQLIELLPESIEKEDKIWFALAAYNMGIAHLIDARSLTLKMNKNPDSWFDVKQTLPLMSKSQYYSKLKYGYARGVQALDFVNNIQQYYISLVGYHLEKQHRQKITNPKQHITTYTAKLP